MSGGSRWLFGCLLGLVIALLAVLVLTKGNHSVSPRRGAPPMAPADAGAGEAGTGEPSGREADPSREDATHNVAGLPAGLLTAEQIHSLILDGSPELDEMDQETRLDAIKQMLRDTIERTMSLEVLDKEFHFARSLWDGAKYEEALAVYLAIYDAASVPENMCRVLRDSFPTFDESWSGPHLDPDAAASVWRSCMRKVGG